MSIVAKATEFQVDPSTMTATYASAADGDALLLSTGIYSTAITFPTDKTITIKAAEGADAKLTFSINGATTNTNGGLIFDGVTIQPVSDYFVSGDMGNMTILAFRNCNITKVNRCLLRTNTAGYTINKIELSNCLISACGNSGYNFLYPKHAVKSIVVQNSTLYNYLNGESFFFANQAVADNVLDFVFENNTIYKWAKSSDRALCNTQTKYSAESTYTFRNNIVNEPGVAGTKPKMLSATGGTLVSENNLIVDYGLFEGHLSPSSQTINDLTLEGLGLSSIGFPDPDNGDFSILSTSTLAVAGKNGACVGDPRWIKTLSQPVLLNTSVEPAGAGAVTPVSGSFEKGSPIKIAATYNYGFRFKEWQDNDGNTLSTENPYSFAANSDMNIKAVFSSVEMLELLANKEGEGANWGKISFSPSVANNRYETGTIVNVSVVPNSVTSFLYWENGATDLARQVKMDVNTTLTATFDVVPFIVGWDFTPLDIRGNRQGDYYSQTDNTGLLNIYNGDGTSTNWGGSTKTLGGITFNCARRYTDAINMTSPRSFVAKFSATGYTSINIKSKIGVDNTCVHAKQKMQYSVDGTNYFDLATIDVSAAVNNAWLDCNAELPAELTEEQKSQVYIRWIPDISSALLGAATGTEGFYLAEIFVFAEKATVSDPYAPVLLSSNPAEGSTTASANGSITLTFNEKVIAGVGEIQFNGKTVTPVFGSKTVSIPYTDLSYGTNYSLTIPNGAFTDLSGNEYAGVTINFTTMTRPQPIARLYDAVVAQDGSGDFTTIQAAVDATPANRTSPWLVFVKNGTYNELVRIPADKPFIYLIGQDKEKTIITFAICCSASATDSGWEYRKELWGMSDCAVVVVSAKDFYAENISFINKYGVDFQNGPMALAMRSNNDRFTFNNCKFRSFQDTWYTTNGVNDRHYAYNCYVEGAVDYIYGSGDVFIDQCTLYNVRSGSIITAPAHPVGTKYGYVFNSCTIDGNAAAADGNLKLGRPWHNEPIAVYLNSKMNILPAPEGWTNMGVIPKLFAEYNSMNKNGAPIDLSNRKTTYTESAGEGGQTVSGLKAVLTQEEAAAYTYENLMKGSDNWNPKAYFEPVSKPSGLTIVNNVLDWNYSNYAICYVVLRDDVVIGFTTEPTFTDLTAQAGNTYIYQVKAANEYGSLSEAATISTATSVGNTVNKQLPIVIGANHSIRILNLTIGNQVQVYNIDGRLLVNHTADGTTLDVDYKFNKGIYIVKVDHYSTKVAI